jgi:site-specific DNA recombinase
LYLVFINTFNVLIENKNFFMKKWKKNSTSDNLLQRYKAKQFIKIIENAETIKEFNIYIYFKMIEKIIVFEGNKIIVTLLDGIQMECDIE